MADALMSEAEVEELIERTRHALDAVGDLDDDAVASILDLEDAQAIAAASVGSLAPLAAAADAWLDLGAAGKALWPAAPAAALRRAFAGVVVAVHRSLGEGGRLDDGCEAAACYAALSTVAEAPSAVAYASCWRSVARLLERGGAPRLWDAVARCWRGDRFAVALSELGESSPELVTRLGACAVAKLPASEDLVAALGAANLWVVEALVPPLVGAGAAAANRARAALAKTRLSDAARLGLCERLCVVGAGAATAARARVCETICETLATPAVADELTAFLAEKLAICDKPNRRAMAADVAGALLARRLDQTAPPADAHPGRASLGDAMRAALTADEDDADPTPAAALKRLLLGRAGDKAPGTRARALAALAALPAEAWADGDLAARAAALSVDRLRRDDRALVRAKAVHCLAAAVAGLGDDAGAWSSIVDAAVLAANDEAISVKVAAVGAIGGWLEGRPGDGALRRAWPAHCLPLIHEALDVMPSLANRVADQLEALVLAPLGGNGAAADAAWALLGACAGSPELRACLRATLGHLAPRRKRPLLGDRAGAALVGAVETAAAAGDCDGAVPALRFLEDVLRSSEEDQVEALEAACLAVAEDATAADAARAAALRALGASGAAPPADRVRQLSFAGVETAAAAVACAAEAGAFDGRSWAAEACGSTAPAALAVIAALAAHGCLPEDDAAVDACADVAYGAARSDSASLRNLGVAALGALARCSAAVARDVVPALAATLDDDYASPAAKVACLACLGDLCVARTSLVEPRARSLCLRLGDADADVRRHAVVVIARLLGRDYLKWRPELVVRFFSCLADAEPANRALARHALVDVLLPKTPTLFVNHVVACLRLYTGDRGDAETADLPRHFGGTAHAARRRAVYRALLAATPDEGKVQVSAKLAREVLAPAADVPSLGPSLRDPESPAYNAVSDALHLLGGDLEVLAPSRKAADDDGADDEAPDAAATKRSKTLAAARGKLLGHMSKLHLLEQVLPILIALKHTLDKLKSPLAAPLVATLKRVLATHGPDVEKVLATDPHLARELKYDLKRSKASKQAAGAEPAVPRSPLAEAN